MKLARKPHTAGDKIRYEIDYSNWLEEGDVLSVTPGDCAVANITTAVTDVVISGLTVQSKYLYFFVSGGSAGEGFTVQVTAKDNRGEIAIDTIEFFVVAP